jgi:glycosyltransferase involved in cell wall biosynthesis
VKISFLLFDAYGVGGTARTVLGTAKGLADAGHEVHVISVFQRRKTPFFPHPEGISIHVLKDITAKPNPPPVNRSQRSQLIHPDDELATWFSQETDALIKDALAQWGGDCLITTRPGFNCLAANFPGFRGIRIGQEHVNLSAHTDSLRKRILRDYNNLDAVVTLTNRDTASYQAVPELASRVVKIPNAVPELELDQGIMRDKAIVAIGRLVPQKGFDLLIDAFADVVKEAPDWSLKIFGSGQELHLLRKRIFDRSLYNSVFLMGSTQEVGRELQQAGIFVLSSRFEGFGIVLIEAMHCGTPVVSFDCPEGPREILEDGRYGMLVPPLDTPALSRALLSMIRDEERRREFSTIGRSRAVDFSQERVNEQWTTLIEDLARKRAA